eukprot:249841-Amphidinium_carterae.1
MDNISISHKMQATKPKNVRRTKVGERVCCLKRGAGAGKSTYELDLPVALRMKFPTWKLNNSTAQYCVSATGSHTRSPIILEQPKQHLLKQWTFAR